MTNQEIIESLKGNINRQLKPLIGNQCILIGLPYYTNTGDVLIWEGTRQFLKVNNIKCIDIASKETFSFKKIPDSVTILMMGGGNFGDIWVLEHDFRSKIISTYPNNRIIILPQSIKYNSMDRLNGDAELYGRHKDLHICARDIVSHELLKTHFTKNHLYLLPDMAFCIEPTTLTKYKKKEEKGTLLVKRTDKEFKDSESLRTEESSNVDVKDWPMIEHPNDFFKYRTLKRLMDRQHIVGSSVVDWYGNNFFRPFMVKNGVEFISRYKYIETTRLHVLILSVLMGKPCKFFDNSYGKNKNYYETWLKELDTVIFVE